MKIIFATNNPHKLEEVRSMVPPSITVLSLSDLDFHEDIPEPYDTLEENAFAKVDYLFEKIGQPCIADDTGLEVHALGMRPGVFSARYAGPEKDDLSNRLKLLREMEHIADRRAQFRTALAFRSHEKRQLFEGIVTGRIDTRPTGTAGFGYDPVFIPDGYGASFGVLPSATKNAISHRRRALEAWLRSLENRL